MLRSMRYAHPRLSIPGESHVIPHFWRAYGDPKDSAAAVELAERWLSHPRVLRWKISLTPADFTGDRSFVGMVHRLLGPILQREGKVRWGDKTPHYVREIPELARLFPGSRFIHIYRDGRDVALSG